MSIYFKITNASEIHCGIQLGDGLNTLTRYSAETDPSVCHGECCAPGTFVAAGHIVKYLDHGKFVRLVQIPTNDAVFGMTYNHITSTFNANKIILGEKHFLGDVSTFKFLMEKGVDLSSVNVCTNYLLGWAARNGYLELVQFFIELNFGFSHIPALEDAASNGHLEIVKILIDGDDWTNSGKYNRALACAAENGHLDIIKFLSENGADYRANDNLALMHASEKGHLPIVKFLVKNGADIHANNNQATKLAMEHGNSEIVDFLTESVINFD